MGLRAVAPLASCLGPGTAVSVAIGLEVPTVQPVNSDAKPQSTTQNDSNLNKAAIVLRTQELESAQAERI